MADPIEYPDADELDIDLTITDAQIDTIAGDIQKVLVDCFKTQRKRWVDMTETEQRMLVEGLGKASRDLTRQLASLVTGWDYPRAVGKIEDFKSKGNGDKGRIECKLSFAQIDDNLTSLGRSVGSLVAVVMFDSDDMMGEREPVKTDPDQPPLPMDKPPAQDEVLNPQPVSPAPVLPKTAPSGETESAPPADAEGGPIDPATSDQPDTEEDLYTRAVAWVRESGRASGAGVQRALTITYGQAVKLIERMEADGIVTPPGATGRRGVVKIATPDAALQTAGDEIDPGFGDPVGPEERAPDADPVEEAEATEEAAVDAPSEGDTQAPAFDPIEEVSGDGTGEALEEIRQDEEGFEMSAAELEGQTRRAVLAAQEAGE